MSAELQSVQNGFLSNRFSQGIWFLVKKLVKEEWILSQEGPGKLVFSEFFLTKREGEKFCFCHKIVHAV